MKALGDSIIFGETEHADNGFKPLAERLDQRMEMLCGLASHLLQAVRELVIVKHDISRLTARTFYRIGRIIFAIRSLTLTCGTRL
jgi:hypothetical protein